MTSPKITEGDDIIREANMQSRKDWFKTHGTRPLIICDHEWLTLTDDGTTRRMECERCNQTSIYQYRPTCGL